MKFIVFILVLTFTLAMLNTQEIESPKLRDTQPASFFDQLVSAYLNVFKSKIETNSMKTEDMKVLEYLLKSIYARQKQIEYEEHNRPIVYWHSRQGRSNQMI